MSTRTRRPSRSRKPRRAAAAAPAAPKAPASEQLVYNVGKWDRYLYGSRRDEGGALEEGEQGIHESISDGEAEAVGSALPADRIEQIKGQAEGVGSEIFSRLYSDPERLEQPGSSCPGWAPKVHDLIDEVDEFEALRKQVSGDPDLSALSSAIIMEQIAPRLRELVKQTPPPQQQQQQSGGKPEDGGAQPGGQQPGGAGGQQPGGSPGQQQGQGGQQPGKGAGSAAQQAQQGGGLPTAGEALRAALRRAAQDAQQKAAEGKAAAGGIDPGLEAAPAITDQEDPDRFNLINLLLNNPEVMKIAQMAGRIRRISRQDKEATRDPDAYEEVVGIERGGLEEVSRLLGSELAMLADPELEVLFDLNMIQRTALCYRLEGTEPQGRGPIVVLTDRSGSMSGQPQRWASALSLAMLSEARKGKRQYTYAGFNCQIITPLRVEKNGSAAMISNDEHLTPVKPMQMGQVAGLIAMQGSGGGTSFDAPLRMAMRSGLLEPRSDLILITDGHASASASILEQLDEARAAGMHAYCFITGGGALSAELDERFDEVCDLREVADAEAALAGAVRKQ